MVLDHERRVREAVVDPTDAHERLGRDGSACREIGESGVEDEFDAVLHQLFRVLMPARRHGVRVQRDQSLEDAAAVVLGFVTSSLDLGRHGSSVRVVRFGAGQGDSVDAGVNLGAAKKWSHHALEILGRAGLLVPPGAPE